MTKSNSCNNILLIFEMPECGAMPFEWGILSTAKIHEFENKDKKQIFLSHCCCRAVKKISPPKMTFYKHPLWPSKPSLI